MGASVADVRHTAALVLAKVAAIEIPNNAWPELIPTLLANAQNTSVPGLRHATLEALGYVCEELGAFEEEYLQPEQVNAILTAVVAGLRQEEPDVEVRLAATVALDNALEFAHANFSNENERNYIMQMVCQGTLASDERIRRAAWECLVDIASQYYFYLPAYMADIFSLTQRAVRSDEEAVGLQALEFWSTVAEEEADRLEEAEDGSAADSERVCHNFVLAALPQLVPLLLEQLTKQEEGADGDAGAWNMALAAGTALGLTAAVVGEPIVELVMPFVQENIQRNNTEEDWRQREAATFAFGCIFEGPQLATLGHLAHSGLGFLLAALKDRHPQVKNTTAWAIGRIFEFVHGEDVNPQLLTSQNLPSVVAALLEALRDETHVAEKVCYAIGQLASGFNKDTYQPQGGALLSPYFKDIVGALLETAARPVADMSEAQGLQMQAFEALNEVVRASPPEAAPLIAQLVPVVIGKLEETSATPALTAEAAEHQSEVQGLLCDVILVAMQKLTSIAGAATPLAQQLTDSVMQALLHVFACRPSTVHEEAMMAVGAVCYVCGRGFGKYMEAFFPVLLRGLQQHTDWQTCQVSLGVLSDVCRVMEADVFPFCHQIMTVLLQDLQSADAHRAVKPVILSVFGDIALAIGDQFEAYVTHVVPMLQGAAGLTVELARDADEDLAIYVNDLRQSILEAWGGLLNGMSKPKADQCLRQYAPPLIEFVESIASDQANKADAVWRRAVEVLGDIASVLSGVGVLFQQKPFVLQFLAAAGEQSPALKETAQWAATMVMSAEASV